MAEKTIAMTLREEQRMLKEARRLAARYVGRAGVIDVELGSKHVRGQRIEKLALRFFVHEKKNERELSPDAILPKKVGSFITDVHQYNVRRQTSRVTPRRRIRPLMGGIKIQSGLYEDNLNWGTMGCRLLVGHESLAFTNYHVLYGNVPTEIVAPHYVNQLPVYQDLNRKSNFIGRAAPSFSKALDFATFISDEPFDPQRSINGIEGLVVSWAHPRLNMPVLKSGATTGITYGVIDGKSVVDHAELSIFIDKRYVTKKDVLSDTGDSGAVWIINDESGLPKPVALHYAQGEGTDWARAKSLPSIFAYIRAQNQRGRGEPAERIGHRVPG